jgi:NAD(P) transhydrogenase subunit alpha
VANESGLTLDLEDEITKGVLITHQGELVHAFTKQILSQ